MKIKSIFSTAIAIAILSGTGSANAASKPYDGGVVSINQIYNTYFVKAQGNVGSKPQIGQHQSNFVAWMSNNHAFLSATDGAKARNIVCRVSKQDNSEEFERVSLAVMNFGPSTTLDYNITNGICQNVTFMANTNFH